MLKWSNRTAATTVACTAAFALAAVVGAGLGGRTNSSAADTSFISDLIADSHLGPGEAPYSPGVAFTGLCIAGFTAQLTQSLAVYTCTSQPLRCQASLYVIDDQLPIPMPALYVEMLEPSVLLGTAPQFYYSCIEADAWP